MSIGLERNPSLPDLNSWSLERIPGGLRREFEIPDIGTQAQAEAGADWHHNNIVRRERRHAETTNEVGRAVDAAEAIEDRLGPRQVVDQHHGARAVGAGVEPDARSLPEHAHVTGISCVQRAVAIAQAAKSESPAIVYITVPPDDIRVSGASIHDGNKTDTRTMVATQRVRR